MSFLDRTKVVLDLGAGAGIVKEMDFRGMAGILYGIDLDQRIESNPFLDKPYVGNGSRMPFFEDELFDVVFCNNVLEHISPEDSVRFFAEVNRIMKPGGVFLTKTPNRYHYVPLIARMTPTIFHKIYNKMRGREEEDTFKTHYAINTKKDQERLAVITGFRMQHIEFLEGRPEYMRLSAPSYLLGFFYERFVNQLNINALKVIIVTVFTKVARHAGEI